MKILLVSATIFEMAPFIRHMDEHYKKLSFSEYESKEHHIFPLVTGVGMVNTVLSITRFQALKGIDVAINIGVAGSFDPQLVQGSVVEVIADRYGDLGVEDKDASFIDIHQLDLIGKDYFPFEDGWLKNTRPKIDFQLPQKSAITVNKVHGSEESISKIKSKYKADIETMEGAAFAQTCMTLDIKYHQIRSISNFVEPRNKENWKLELAIDNLNQALVHTLG